MYKVGAQFIVSKLVLETVIALRLCLRRVIKISGVSVSNYVKTIPRKFETIIINSIAPYLFRGEFRRYNLELVPKL